MKNGKVPDLVFLGVEYAEVEVRAASMYCRKWVTEIMVHSLATGQRNLVRGSLPSR